jgi:hypothetical protein
VGSDKRQTMMRAARRRGAGMTLGMIGRLRPSLIALPTIMSGYNRRDQLRKKCDRTMLLSAL